MVPAKWFSFYIGYNVVLVGRNGLQYSLAEARRFFFTAHEHWLWALVSPWPPVPMRHASEECGVGIVTRENVFCGTDPMIFGPLDRNNSGILT